MEKEVKLATYGISAGRYGDTKDNAMTPCCGVDGDTESTFLSDYKINHHAKISFRELSALNAPDKKPINS